MPLADRMVPPSCSLCLPRFKDCARLLPKHIYKGSHRLKNQQITKFEKHTDRLHVYWKHTLETMSFGNIICVWKQKIYIGNIKRRLETYSGYWKHHSEFGFVSRFSFDGYSNVEFTLIRDERIEPKI